jgi:uncharacterized protein (TIGR02996 family)
MPTEHPDYRVAYARSLRRKYALSSDDEAFHRAIAVDPTDHGPRLVYADWLDDNERHEEAERERLKARIPIYDERKGDHSGRTYPGDHPHLVVERDPYRSGRSWMYALRLNGTAVLTGAIPTEGDALPDPQYVNRAVERTLAHATDPNRDFRWNANSGTSRKFPEVLREHLEQHGM